MRPVPRPFCALVLTLLLAAAGCVSEPSGPVAEESAAGNDAPASGSSAGSGEATAGTVAAADGVPIVYWAAGGGDTAVVFVHCWACNHEFWRHQVEPVAAAGYRVVTLDLPGHGDSGDDRTEWSIPGLAADVATVIDELGLERVLLVGHSMGGPVSVEVARRLPGRVAGIACVDTLHNAEQEFPPEVAESMAESLRQDYRGGLEAFIPQIFREDSDPELVRWVIEQGVETASHEATIALMGAFVAWDARAALAAAGVPIRCINAAPVGGRGLPTEVEINRKYADFDAVIMDGVGHYPQLERPEEFNTLLLETLGQL